MFFGFFFNDTATTEIYTLSLHDALPISKNLKKDRRHHKVRSSAGGRCGAPAQALGNLLLCQKELAGPLWKLDRKSTRLNSSHSQISYAVFCLKKKRLVNHKLKPPCCSQL